MLLAEIAALALRVCMIDFKSGEYAACLVSAVFDIILALGVYAFVKALSGTKRAVTGYCITLFLPNVLMNTAFDGTNITLFVPLAVWFLYFLYLQRYKISFIILGAGTAAELYITCLLTGKTLSEVIGSRRYISRNNPSLWNLFDLSFEADAVWCTVFTCAVLAALIFLFRREKADVKGKHFIWCAFLIVYTCTIFLPCMNERSSYLYAILALILAFTDFSAVIATFAFQLISLKTYSAAFFHTSMNLQFLSIVTMLVYAFMFYAFCRELCGRPLKTDIFEISEKGVSTDRLSVKENIKPGRKDFIAIIILTGIFLLMASMHLGRCEAPSTYEEFGRKTEQGKEIYVTLKSLQDVGAVCIYSFMSGSESFELYYAEDGEWVKIDEELALKGVFTWRKVDVDVRTHQFCIIFRDPSVQIAEVVCLDKYGKRIEPAEDCEPRAIFDEQEMLPSTPTSYDSMIFDEIYHGRTAYEFINGMKIYENTHPPLGKTLISIGIRLFGMNPFGYRIIVLLFGVMCIPVMYLLALKVTGDSRYAVLAGVLQITEFMHFVLSRISTIDIIVAFFVLCMFYGCVSFIREERFKYIVFAGTAFALGVSTKWTALYAAAGIALILFVWMIGKIRSKCKASVIFSFFLICIGCFIVLPAIVYVLSYIPFVKVYPEDNLIGHAISNSISMYDYHKNVTAPHPYASPWYSWLVDQIPLMDSRAVCGDRMAAVATFVNPLVCFGGLVSLLHHVYMTVKKKDVTSELLVVFYVSMLLPWVFITRTVFIYQYFICTKVLILMICNSIRCIGFKKENSVIKFTAGVSVALFVIYFPVLAGLMVNMKYIKEILSVLPDWRF